MLGNLEPFFTIIQQNTIENWQKIFWLAGGLSIFGTLIFLLMAGGHELPWAKAPEEDESSGEINKDYGSLLLCKAHYFYLFV